MNLFEFDRSYGCKKLCGVDEAGRGPLAGPVVAAAIILKEEAASLISDVDDSKKFSEKKRSQLYFRVLESALSFAFEIVEPSVIDNINILNATMLAMKRAVEKLNCEPDFVLVDGNKLPNLKYSCEYIVKGDSKSASIAAASIVAKFERDKIMIENAAKYPQYGFEKNKGYGTKQHYESLRKFGITPLHRVSFLKKLKEQKQTASCQKIYGKQGEKVAYLWLCKNGFRPIKKNFSTRYGEIDIIAVKGSFLYFVEVKLRKFGGVYSPREAVDLRKQKKIIKTAAIFISDNKIDLQPKFAVIEIFRKNSENFSVNFIDDAFFAYGEFELFKDCF